MIACTIAKHGPKSYSFGGPVKEFYPRRLSTRPMIIYPCCPGAKRSGSSMCSDPSKNAILSPKCSQQRQRWVQIRSTCSRALTSFILSKATPELGQGYETSLPEQACMWPLSPARCRGLSTNPLEGFSPLERWTTVPRMRK